MSNIHASEKFKNFKTDTSKKSIDLSLVYDWWPWKDWIPSIDSPDFLSIDEALELSFLSSDSLWASVSIDWKAKFYPFAILNWHEIVNDELAWKNIAVTFCPLCWSSIVYDRKLDDMVLVFWVSGKLYESNLLMYDKYTESFWSQSLGEAVIWDYVWTKLKIISSNIVSLEEFQKNYPDWLILWIDKNSVKNYDYIPYSGYSESDTLYYPVSNLWDTQLPRKEILYAVKDWTKSIAFHFNNLKKKGVGEIEIDWKKYVATYKNGKIEVVTWQENLPWYFEMWFSWANHNFSNNNLWTE